MSSVFSGIFAAPSVSTIVPPSFATNSDIAKAIRVELADSAKKMNLLGLAHPSVIGGKSALSSVATPKRSRNRGKNKASKSKQLVFPQMGSAVFDNLPYKFVQQYDASSSIFSSVTLNTYTAAFFQLSFLDQSSSLMTVFDQYRISLIEVTFLPRSNVNTSATGFYGNFYTVVDYDDSTALTTLAAASDYTNCIMTEGYKEHQHTFVPHVGIAASGGGVFTSYANEQAPWIDCSSNTVSHFGVKTAWSVTSAVCTYDVRQRVFLEFRNVR
jgi:hypothetical protein